MTKEKPIHVVSPFSAEEIRGTLKIPKKVVKEAEAVVSKLFPELEKANKPKV